MGGTRGGFSLIGDRGGEFEDEDGNEIAVSEEDLQGPLDILSELLADAKQALPGYDKGVKEIEEILGIKN